MLAMTAPLRRLSHAMTRLAGSQKRIVLFAFDGLAMLTALWLAFSARLGVLYWPANPRVLFLAVASMMLGLLAVMALRLYRLVVRYFEASAAAKVETPSAAAAAAWLGLAYFSRIENLPRSVGLIYFGLLFMLLFFGRLAASRLLGLSYGFTA